MTQNSKKIALVGFSQATLVKDFTWLIKQQGHRVYVIDPDTFLSSQCDDELEFLVAITKDMNLRQQCVEHIGSAKKYTYIHESAQIANDASVGAGCFIAPFCLISSGAVIGSDCIISPYSMVSHASMVGKGTILQPGCLIAGSTVIKEFCKFGMKSTVLDHLSLAAYTEVGAGAMVTKNIQEQSMLAIGAPAKLIKKQNV